jgi:hypothetical protein
VVVGTTNLLMLSPFVLLNAIKQQQPTAARDGIWVWQFEDENGAFRLEIFDEGPSSLAGASAYRFVIYGGDTTDELLEVISGEYTLAEGRFLGAQRGFGVLHFNFDNMRAVDKKEDEVYGQMYIAFRVLGGVKQVTVVTDDVRKLDEENEGLASAQYEYVQFRENIGQFSYASRTDFLKDAEPLETMAVHSTWDREFGRSVSRVSDGSLEINELILEECWERGRVTFADMTPDIPELNYEDGTRDDCLASVREIELNPPQLETPGRLTDPPGPHPDEESEVIVDP